MAPADIGFVMNVAGEDYINYSELDAAVRAYNAGDSVPLVRLVNEAYAYEEGLGGDGEELQHGHVCGCEL